jgi:hypothetical protein
MKIIIILLVPILLGIVVGSNLSPVMTVVILNQPTVALPIGVWLTIAIGLGLLSSSLIQLAIFVDRRLLKRQISQLRSRLQQSDEDIFTYTSSAPESEKSSTDKPASANAAKTNRFSSYRFGKADATRTKVATQFTTTAPVKPRSIDDDDWDAEPAPNRQLEWEDPIPPRQQKIQSPSNRVKIENERIDPNRRTQIVESEPEQTRQIYDVDFRLIQPPYKQPIETEFDRDRESEDFEYTEIDEEDEDFDSTSASVNPTATNRSTSSQNLDDEDWGFDFDNADAPVRAN